jgi:hypothetical protein
MREADLMLSRRRFLIMSLKASAGVAAGLIVGPEVFEALDRLGPRRLMVPGAIPEKTLRQLLKEVYGGTYLQMYPLNSPIFAKFTKHDSTKWGGSGVYFDLIY